jgi:hypothetical protein
LSSSERSSRTPLGAAVTRAQSAADPQAAAIQHVIEQANSEQAQALSSQDPAVMSDTATAGYYQQLVQTNQSLLSQGVTAIELTNVAWGPISVSGSTATATTTETWVTTFSDSTTLESTDTNLYTLVNQAGSWLIQDDQQPSAAGQSPQPAPGAGAPPQPTPLPSALTGRATSHNWSGYAATGDPYTGVSGTWIVPQPSSSSAARRRRNVGRYWRRYQPRSDPGRDPGCCVGQRPVPIPGLDRTTAGRLAAGASGSCAR